MNHQQAVAGHQAAVNRQQPLVGHQAAFEQESNRDDALLLATIQSIQQGTFNLPNLPIVVETPSGDGPGIADSRAQMLADFATHREEWTWSDILLMMTSVGLKVVGVDGRLHSFVRAHKKHYKRVLSTLYNPDNLSSISNLAQEFRNPNLYPTSMDHLFKLLNREYLHCHRIPYSGYKALPGTTNARHLSNYIALMQKLATNVLQEVTNKQIQSNPHHIIIYFAFTITDILEQ